MINLSPIDPESDRAGYRQIADQIRSAIHEGRLVPGEQLRSEAKMRKEAGVSRGTLRDGLLLLKGEGLLVPRQGKGWFVQGS